MTVNFTGHVTWRLTAVRCDTHNYMRMYYKLKIYFLEKIIIRTASTRGKSLRMDDLDKNYDKTIIILKINSTIRFTTSEISPELATSPVSILMQIKFENKQHYSVHNIGDFPRISHISGQHTNANQV